MKNIFNKFLTLVMIFTITISSLVGLTACDKCGKYKIVSDQVIIGNFYTGDHYGEEKVTAIAIKDGKIIFAGDKEYADNFIVDGTEVTKFENGELITAGLVDGHTHSTQYLIGLNSNMCVIEKGASQQDCVDILTQFIADNPTITFIVATGWELGGDFGIDDPTASVLDEIDTQLPILASSADGHSYWVNSILMDRAGVNKYTEEPDGGVIVRDNENNPTGCFKDTAKYIIDRVREEKSKEVYEKGILDAEDFNINTGYVCRFQAGDNEQYDLTKAPIIEYQEELDKKGLLKTYTQASFVINNTEDAIDMVDKAIEYKEKTAGGNFEVTAIKIFLDGIVENGGAYLSSPYANNEDSIGGPIWSGEMSIFRLAMVIAKANDNGMSVHFHSMGDKATSTALKAIEMAALWLGTYTVCEARNSIVHLALVSDTDYAKFYKYGVTAVLNPWCFKDPSYYGVQVNYLGQERADKQYPMHSFVENDVKISFGTDFGASFTYTPIECFHALTTRTYKNDDVNTLLNAEEKLTRMEALDAMTSGCAYQMKKEDCFGKIECGYEANLTVFDKDILTIDDSEIMSTKIIKTMYKGTWNNLAD